MKIFTSWDDGLIYDIELAELLRKYKIPAVFYIPTCCDLIPDMIRGLSKDFEIGGHSKTHPADLKNLDDELLYQELNDNRKWLEYLTGKKITKFCYPRGRYNDRVIKIVKKAGFKEARTTVIGSIYPALDPFKTPTTVHCFQRKEYEGVPWLDYAKQKYLEAKALEGSVFHLWGHSRELFLDDGWSKLEEFFKFITNEMEKSSLQTR